MYYLWLKAFHLISVIAWMAGLLYLPRLFVYHTTVAVGSDQDKLFQTMEKKLLRIIMNPAMIFTFILGILLLIETKAYQEGWFHAKALLVLLMAGFHGFLAKCYKGFSQGKNLYSGTAYRILNEVPTLLMVFIVILAVIKSF